ncbi:hypothetical protein [Streptomyces sp. PU_AKi4]|uniref:hypothetical protein n=1 Tax=Streptomyces sp. PU_AKi4 TaxID=2800809 RepID=UPI00352501F1
MQLVAVSVDETTEDRISRRSGNLRLSQNKFTRRMARPDRNWNILNGRRRRVVMTTDADDQERQQFVQAGRLDTQKRQQSQNPKGSTGLAQQPAVMPVRAVGVLKARKRQEGFRRQRPEVRDGHTLKGAEHPQRNLGGIQHPHPAGVPADSLLLFRFKVTYAFR